LNRGATELKEREVSRKGDEGNQNFVFEEGHRQKEGEAWSVLDRMDRESRKVDDILHKATRRIIERAK